MFAEGTRKCTIQDCWFDAVGGNGVFVNNYNREFTVTGCKFTETGDSAMCFVGDLEKTNGTQRAFPTNAWRTTIWCTTAAFTVSRSQLYIFHGRRGFRLATT